MTVISFVALDPISVCISFTLPCLSGLYLEVHGISLRKVVLTVIVSHPLLSEVVYHDPFDLLTYVPLFHPGSEILSTFLIGLYLM